MRGLQRADHGLFVTVCRRHLVGSPVPGVPGGGLAGGPCPAASAGIAVTGVPAATPGYVHGMLPGAAWHGSWHGTSDTPSTTSAVSAIIRVIGAASAFSARGRGYGKEKFYGSIP